MFALGRRWFWQKQVSQVVLDDGRLCQERMSLHGFHWMPTNLYDTKRGASQYQFARRGNASISKVIGVLEEIHPAHVR